MKKPALFDIIAIVTTAMLLLLLVVGLLFAATLPAIMITVVLAVIYLVAPIKQRAMAPAWAMLAGQAACLLVVALHSRAIGFVAIGFVLVVTGMILLALWPGLVVTGLVTICQSIWLGVGCHSLVAAVLRPSFAYRPLRYSYANELIVEIVLGTYALVWVWLGWRRFVRTSADRGMVEATLVASPALPAARGAAIEAEIIEPASLPGPAASAGLSLAFGAAAAIAAAIGTGVLCLLAPAPPELNWPALVGSSLFLIASIVGLVLFRLRETRQRSIGATALAMTGIPGNVAALAILAYCGSAYMTPAPPGGPAGSRFAQIPSHSRGVFFPPPPPPYQPPYEPPTQHRPSPQNPPSPAPARIALAASVWRPYEPPVNPTADPDGPDRLGSLALPSDNARAEGLPRITRLKLPLAARRFWNPRDRAVWSPDGEHLFLLDDQGRLLDVRKRDWTVARSVRLRQPANHLFWAKDWLAATAGGGTVDFEAILVDPGSLQPLEQLDVSVRARILECSASPASSKLLVLVERFAHFFAAVVNIEPPGRDQGQVEAPLHEVFVLSRRPLTNSKSCAMLADGKSAYIFDFQVLRLIDLRPGHVGALVAERKLSPSSSVLAASRAPRLFARWVTPGAGRSPWRVFDPTDLTSPIAAFAADSFPDVDPKSGNVLYIRQGHFCILADKEAARISEPVTSPPPTGRRGTMPPPHSSIYILANPAGNGALVIGGEWSAWVEWSRLEGPGMEAEGKEKIEK